MKRVQFLISVSIILLFFCSSLIAQKRYDNKIGLNKSKISKNENVEFGQTQAFSDGNGVLLKWETKSEIKNVGFNIYKIVDGQKILVNEFLVGGGYAQNGQEEFLNGNYSFFDVQGNFNQTYFIESYGISGKRVKSEFIFPESISDPQSAEGRQLEGLRQNFHNKNNVVTREEITLTKQLIKDIGKNTIEADQNIQRTVAAQPGVKIGVKKEGFYRVSRAELQAAGFDVNAPAANWQLYVNGVEQAIIVEPNGNYIEFYGKGINTLESNTQIYFLTAGSVQGKRIAGKIQRQLRANVFSNGYRQTFFKEERAVYASSVLNGEHTNFFGTVVNGDGGTINFNLSGIDFLAPTTTIEVNVQGLSLAAHTTNIKLNGTEIGILSGSFRNLMTKTLEIPTSLLREGSNTLLLTATGGSSDLSLFDSINVNYPRIYKADQNSLSFYTNNYRAAKLEGFSSSNIRVFDISDPDSPALYSNLKAEQVNNSFGLTLSANRSRLLFAVGDEGLLKADSLVQNTPSTLSTANHNADLVIISYEGFLAQSNDWANYRKADGLSVEVANVQDVFDEFNYGVVNSEAIRRFLQYASENWQTKPRYVLLMGDSTYDPKNHTGNPFQNFVPIKIVDTIYLETGSDEAMADFNDDGLAEIAIGRIPAQDTQTISRILGKVNLFEQSIAQARLRGALFVSDLPDGYDFAGLSQRLSNQLPSNIPNFYVNRGEENAQAKVIEQINQGRYIVNYSGHGNASDWASRGFFSSANLPQINNSFNLSIFTMLTCLNGYFIVPTSESLGELLLQSDKGGAVSAWASSGLTTPDIQEIMATRFYSQLGSGNMTRLGDLIKDAKTTIPGGRDVRLSWVLLGDPTLKVK